MYSTVHSRNLPYYKSQCRNLSRLVFHTCERNRVDVRIVVAGALLDLRGTQSTFDPPLWSESKKKMVSVCVYFTFFLGVCGNSFLRLAGRRQQ